MDVQYLQNVIFSFKEDSNGQIHSSSNYHHPIKESPSKISHRPTTGGHFPYYLTLFGKACEYHEQK